MEDNSNTKVCTGDCTKCNQQQRLYCSAQFSRNLIDMVNALNMRVQALTETVERLTASDAAEVFNPMQPEVVESDEDANAITEE